MKTWILVDDGKTGTENQCLGLTDALGLHPSIFRVTLNIPFKWWPKPAIKSAPNTCNIHPDMPMQETPDIIVTAGRKSAGLAVYIKQYRAPNATLVALQTPPLPTDLFDWVIAPEHDNLSGDNILATKGALNRITQKNLQDRAKPFESALTNLPRPLSAALIGGTAKGVNWPIKFADQLGIAIADACPGSLMLTTSRRTPAEVAETIKKRVNSLPGIQYYGNGQNPYSAILAFADSILVTSDSISMISEACSAGKPVYIAQVPGKRNKFQSFIDSLYEMGVAKPFDGTLRAFPTPGLNETQRIAEHLKDTTLFTQKNVQ